MRDAVRGVRFDKSTPDVKQVVDKILDTSLPEESDGIWSECRREGGKIGDRPGQSGIAA